MTNRQFRILNPRYNLLRPTYWFGQVDTRPLSVFRILFSLLLLKDAVYHIVVSRRFYSDSGIVPRQALDGLLRSERFSLMDALPSQWMVIVFFLLWIAVLISLLLGYRVRLMTVLNFVIVLSINERNPFILNGANTVMRVLSFWAIFLPLGHYYSIDAVRRRLGRFRRSRNLADLRVSNEAYTTHAFPLRLFQLQVAMVYFFTAILKAPLQDTAWTEGTALFYALQVKSLVLPSGDLLLNIGPEWLLSLITVQTMITEIVFLFFVFSPFFQPALRGTALVLGVLLHLGIAVTMSVPNFSAVMIISYLSFFQPEWIEWVDARLRSLKPRRYPSTISLPGRGSPLWLLLAITRENEVQVDTSARVDSNDTPALVILDEDRRALHGMRAWQRVVGHLPLSRVWVRTLRFAFVRRLARRSVTWWVAREFPPYAIPEPDVAPILAGGESRVAGLSRLVRRSVRFSQTAALAGMMGAVIMWNVSSLELNGERLTGRIGGVPRKIVLYTGTWQIWNMFAPFPKTDDGWIVIPGEFEDGTSFDLLTEQPVDYVTQTRWYWGPDMFWKKYTENIRRKSPRSLLSAWGSFYCRSYNEQQGLPEGKRLATLEIHFLHRRSYEPGGEENPLENSTLWRHWCYEEYRS